MELATNMKLHYDGHRIGDRVDRCVMSIHHVLTGHSRKMQGRAVSIPVTLSTVIILTAYQDITLVIDHKMARVAMKTKIVALEKLINILINHPQTHSALYNEVSEKFLIS